MKIARTLIRPVITEKSTMLNEQNRYVFDVDMKSNKYDIARAVEWAFDVKVVSVSTYRRRGKMKRRGFREKKRPDVKRAIVTLAPGEPARCPDPPARIHTSFSMSSWRSCSRPMCRHRPVWSSGSRRNTTTASRTPISR